MNRRLLAGSIAALLCACTAPDPNRAPSAALICGEPQTGSNLVRRRDCVAAATPESREKARQDAESMRDQQSRTQGAAAGKGP